MRRFLSLLLLTLVSAACAPLLAPPAPPTPTPASLKPANLLTPRPATPTPLTIPVTAAIGFVAFLLLNPILGAR